MTSGLVDGLVPPRSLSSNGARRVPTKRRKRARENMSDSVGQYLNEIGMVPLLNAQEER